MCQISLICVLFYSIWWLCITEMSERKGLLVQCFNQKWGSWLHRIVLWEDSEIPVLFWKEFVLWFVLKHAFRTVNENKEMKPKRIIHIVRPRLFSKILRWRINILMRCDLCASLHLSSTVSSQEKSLMFCRENTSYVFPLKCDSMTSVIILSTA